MTETQALWFTISLFATAHIIAAWKFGRWGLLQMAVFSAVICSGIYWKWTIGGYATSMVAAVAAFTVTVVVGYLVALTQAAVAMLRRAMRPSERPSADPGSPELSASRRRLTARG